MKPIRWGILSTAEIAAKQVVPAIDAAGNAEVVAVASRDFDKAKNFADNFGVPKAYGTYDALLADPEIDAIYNPLPNHLHVPMTLSAGHAGKHVLCEKPIGLTAADAAQLLELPSDIMVMEAFMVRFHPQWHKVRELVSNGSLGDVKAAQGFFSFYNIDPGNIRQKREWGGGALLDIGVYPLVTSRFVFNAEPVRVMALVERDQEFGIDSVCSCMVDFGLGRHLTFTVSTQLAGCQSMIFYGSKQRAEVNIPFTPSNTADAKIRLNDGTENSLAGDEVIEVPAVNQYQLEIEAFSNAILTGEKLPYGIKDAIQSMKILDACFRSELSGAWEAV